MEAALVDGIKVFGAGSLKEVIEHVDTPKKGADPKVDQKILAQPKNKNKLHKRIGPYGFADIRGQEGAKRGLEIAAAGGHNIAMYGPPGTGKTMLARAFSQLLPDLKFGRSFRNYWDTFGGGKHAGRADLLSTISLAASLRHPMSRLSAAELIRSREKSPLPIKASYF